MLIEKLTRQSSRLIRLAVGLGMSATKAEDVLQDVSVNALKHQDLELTDQEARAWLICTTINRCNLEYRKGSRRQRYDRGVMQNILPKLNTAGSPDGDAIRGEHLDMLNETLTDLIEDLLMPLVLRYFCDMNSTEIGDVLKLTPSAVRSRLQERRLNMAKALIKRGFLP